MHQVGHQMYSLELFPLKNCVRWEPEDKGDPNPPLDPHLRLTLIWPLFPIHILKRTFYSWALLSTIRISVETFHDLHFTSPGPVTVYS